MSTTSTKLQNLDPATAARLEKLLEKQEQEMTARREAIRKEYPKADADTLVFDETAKKFKVQISCEVCGEKVWKFTSDLHQSTSCAACRETVLKNRRAERAANNKAAAELLKQYGSVEAVKAALAKKE